MELLFHKKFKRLYKKQPQAIQKKFTAKLRVFMKDPFDEQLHNHALTGELARYRSINITGDVRAWYEVSDGTIVFHKIGSHSELYG